MPAITGNGGNITFGAVAFHISKWTLIKDPRLVETTTSANTSGTRYTKVVNDNSGTVEAPWDSTATPEAAGFVEGAAITLLKMKLGSGATYYSAANCTMGPLEVECDNKGDVVRIRFSWKGGDVTGPA